MSKPRTIAEYPNRADDYDGAVSKSHVQNTDTVLDQGGDNEVTAEEIRDHVDSTDNPHGTTARQVGAYTKGEVGDLLDDKFDKSGGTIEGVTIIETDSANGLEIIRTGSNGGRARLRILNADNSGLAPEFTITGDGTSDTPGLPVYIPGRISTRDGFYIGSTRKDLEWDAKADQDALNTTNQAVSANTGSIEELQGRFETGTWLMQLIGTEGGAINFTATYSRVGDLVHVVGGATGDIGNILTGDIMFVGLGYNAPSSNSAGICVHGNNIDYPAGASTLSFRTVANSDEILLQFMASGSLISLNSSHFTGGTVLRLSLTYITNDPFDS